jgi:hypothetical protein
MYIPALKIDLLNTNCWETESYARLLLSSYSITHEKVRNATNVNHLRTEACCFLPHW